MLCITETWLNSDVTGAEISLENYNIFRGVADEEEALLSMLSLNFCHAGFPLTSKLISPLQKLSRAKSPTHPNYSPYSEYTEVQPLRKLKTNKSSVSSALSPINRAFVVSWKFLCSTHQMADGLVLSFKWFLNEALWSCRRWILILGRPGLGLQPLTPRPRLYQIPGRRFICANAGPAR